MNTQAIIGLVRGQFIATLKDGSSIEHSDIHHLASALYQAGVKAKGVHYEWRPGQRMITAGQQVALRAALRQQEASTAALPSCETQSV